MESTAPELTFAFQKENLPSTLADGMRYVNLAQTKKLEEDPKIKLF